MLWIFAFANEALAKSESFYLLSQGLLEEKYKFYLHNSTVDSELLSVKFAKDSIFQKSLPTNILNATSLDLEMFKLLATNPIRSRVSFDSLFVPFRCVASDIVEKESILFKDGSLNTAVRASMTYPFFISPIRVNGKLLFDGGLYNNFPAQSLLDEFDVDFVIGSNVSYNEPPPTEEDLMSQIKNLFSQHSDYKLPCENSVLIEPNLGDISTFDFEKIGEAIEIGYLATIDKIDSIRLYVETRIPLDDLYEKRKAYHKDKIKLSISNITTTGLTTDESVYIEQKLIKSKKKGQLNLNNWNTVI